MASAASRHATVLASGVVYDDPARREGRAIGPTELIIILVIVLVLFGAKKIPEIARSLGSGAREFKEGITGEEKRGGDAIDPPASPTDKDTDTHR